MAEKFHLHVASARQAIAALMQVLGDPYRKPLPRLLSEFVDYSLRKRDPGRYLSSFLYRKGVERPTRYLSYQQYHRLRALVERPEVVPLFQNKLLFQRHFEGSGIRLPAYLGHIEGGRFHPATGGPLRMTSAADLERIACDLLSGGRSSFFAKPFLARSGKGAFKITQASDFGALFKAVARESYLLQETLAQHPALAAVHPQSLNTLRVTTCQLRNAAPQTACAYVRFGRGGSDVDNSFVGGLYAGVDLDSGRICTPGLTTFVNGGRVFERHPDSGIALRGYEIPLFHDGLKLVRAAAAHLPYPLAGWDLAIMPDGPAICEGNHAHNYYGDEIASGPYIDNPVLRPFIDELTGQRWL